MKACEDLSIEITAKEARLFVDDYLKQKGRSRANQSGSKTKRPKFTQEAFVDAIVEFIVADDQVHVR